MSNWIEGKHLILHKFNISKRLAYIFIAQTDYNANMLSILTITAKTVAKECVCIWSLICKHVSLRLCLPLSIRVHCAARLWCAFCEYLWITFCTLFCVRNRDDEHKTENANDSILVVRQQHTFVHVNILANSLIGIKFHRVRKRNETALL